MEPFLLNSLLFQDKEIQLKDKQINIESAIERQYAKIQSHERELEKMQLKMENMLQLGAPESRSWFYVNRKRLDNAISEAEREIWRLNRAMEELACQLEQLYFENALQSTDKTSLGRAKVMVVGEGGAGKTSTIRSLLGEAFESQVNSTCGILVRQARLSGYGSWKEVTERQFAAQHAYKMVEIKERVEPPPPTTFLKKANTNNVRSNASKKSNKEDSETSQTQPSNKAKDKAPGAVLVGLPKAVKKNPKKKPMPAIVTVQQPILLHPTRDEFLEAKKKSQGANVSVWDYGGQNVFHAMHHLFLTSKGVYFLVFSLPALVDVESEKSNESMKHIKLWLQTLQLHAPEAPILMVGTGSDHGGVELIDTAEEKLRAGLGSLLDIVNSQHQQEVSFMPISNKTNRMTNRLRSWVWNVVETEHNKCQASVRWTRCLDTLMEHSPYVKLVDCKTIAKSYGITSVEEVTEMLSVFHELGLILYFTASETLSNLIITEPPWLLNAISYLIRDAELHGFNDEDWGKIVSANLEKDAVELLYNGLASRDVLECLWGIENADYLLDLLPRMFVLSKYKQTKSSTIYMVPSMVRSEIGANRIKGRRKQAATFSFDFTFLPSGIFSTMVCLAITNWEVHKWEKPQVYRDTAILKLSGSNKITMYHTDTRIVVAVGARTSKPEKKNTLMRFKRLLEKVSTELFDGMLQWQLYLFTSRWRTKGILFEDAMQSQAVEWLRETESNESSRFAVNIPERLLRRFLAA